MGILKNILIFGLALVLCHITAESAYEVYAHFYPASLGGFIDTRPLIGFPLSYIFSCTLLYTALGDKRKYVWMAVVLLPALAFEAYFDFSHIHFLLLFILGAWSSGCIIKQMVVVIKNHYS